MAYEVRKAYTNTFDRCVASYEDLMAFVGRKASKYNCGIYRHWEADGVLYFDIGPTVYAVREIKI